MVGTRDLARLLDAAEQAQAKLVLVGDDRQLPEIQAGGLFSALADRLGAIELTRGPPPARGVGPRRARGAARRRRRPASPRAYHEHGRIVAAPDRRGGARALVDRLAAGRDERGEQRADARPPPRATSPTSTDARATRLRARRPHRRRRARDRRPRVRGRRSRRRPPQRPPARRRQRRHRPHRPRSPTARVAVELDDGATVELPERVRRAPATSSTATRSPPTSPRARPSTAPSCSAPTSSTASGATPRSRATATRRASTSARRRRSSTRAAAPLSAAADTTRAVTRMLSASRAQRLALDGLAPDPMRGSARDALNHARGELAAIDARLSDLERERTALRWYERAARRELERRMANWERPREHWLSETERLAREIDARPAPVASLLSRRSTRSRDRAASARPRPPSRHRDRAVTGQLQWR